jgi:membrane fusion protein, multidrug efflux system
MSCLDHSPLRRIRRLSLGLGAAVGGLLVAGCGGPLDASSQALETAVPVRVVQVAEQGGSETLRFAGTVRARQRASLTFQVGGVLKARDAELGQRVEMGQVLARLYNPELEPGRDAGRARVSELEAQARQAERDLERAEQLHSRGVVSASEREQQRARLDALKAAVSSASAAARQTEQLQSESSLRAPFTGIIEAVLAEPGEFVGPGQPVFRLAADSGLEVEVRVPAAMLDGLEIGQMVRVRNSLNGQELSGRVAELGQGASELSALYPLVVSLDRAEARTGDAVEVALPVPTTGGLTLPLAAIMRSASGLSVFQVVDGRVRRVPVMVSQMRGDFAVLGESLLQPGDQVVYAGLTRLAEQDRVELLP